MPNPVTSSAEIQMSLKENAHVNVAVFNILGEEVASFNDLYLEAGANSIYWNTGSLSNGIYLIKLNIGRQQLTKKVLILR